MSANVTADFIFGTLATDDSRLDVLRAAGRAVHHANRTVPVDPLPDEPVELVVSVGTEVAAARVVAWYSTGDAEPTPDAPHILLEPGHVVWDTLLWGYRREWRGSLPTQPTGTLVRYRVAAETHDGPVIWADPDPWTGLPATFAYHVDRLGVPTWLRDAVVYHDRFAANAGVFWDMSLGLDQFFGGTLRGILDRLPYLAALGVTCLWLSPVFPSPSHHGYDATDYLAVEPRLGSADDLHALLAAAHAQRIRVLLDFVANHVSSDHPAFRRARADSNAPERSWFTFDASGAAYRSFFGVASMPQLDTDDRGAANYLIAAATHWLRQGVDGFRLDYANGPSHGFWSAFRAAAREANPDAALLGEVVETAELQRSYQGRLDGTLDFLLLQQFRGFFAFETLSAPAFAAFLDRHLAFFPADFVLPSFLDNHDMNRFLWIVNGDTRRLKLAALCQFTLPHPPIVYYGTEVGLSQRHDLTCLDGSRRLEESRLPMPWGADQDRDLLRFYSDLIALRRRSPDLWRGRRTSVAATAAGLYAVSITTDRQHAVVAFNRGHDNQRLELANPPTLALATASGVRQTHRDLFLPPMAGALLLAQT